MQLNVSLIYDRINQGIKESVESLKDYPKELELKGGRAVFASFIKNDSATEKRFELLDFNDYDHFRFSDHLIARRGKGKGVYLAGVSYHHSTETGFFLRFNKISATEIECIVEEKVALSAKDSNLHLYEDDHRVYTYSLSYRELVDLLVKIYQCTPNTLLQSMFPNLRDGSKSKFKEICNENGELKEEYKDENIYELLEKCMPLETFRDDMFTRRALVGGGVPIMNRGWSKSYKFTVDISDAIVHLNESQMKLIPKIEDRIREVLNEKVPRCVERRVIDQLNLDVLAENIAVRDPKCETDVFTNIEVEGSDDDLENIALAILEGRKCEDIIFGTSDGIEQFVSLEKYLRSDGSKDSYRFELRFKSRVSGLSNYMFYKDGYLMYLDDFIEDVMKENGLSEDQYESVREEIFETYQNTLSLSHWDVVGVRLSIDFSDLFED